MMHRLSYQRLRACIPSIYLSICQCLLPAHTDVQRAIKQLYYDNWNDFVLTTSYYSFTECRAKCRWPVV